MRPLERGALLLELTQRLLPRQVFPLERRLGLGESSLLLLESGLRLLVRGPFLTELLLRRGERLDLARQGRPQPLCLLGLFLGLALSGPRPLEGRAVLLELGAGSGDHGLPRRRYGARPRKVLASPAQRVVPLHQRRPHPLDRGGAFRGLGALLWRQVQQASALYASHRSGDLRASTRASRASYFPRYQRRSASRRSRALYLSRARRSRSCCQQERREEESGRARTRKREGGETVRFDEIQLTWKTRHAGPLWIRSASFSARLSEAP
jgi:hypothetical protein